MAYEKTTWAKGDVVTSTKLNNIENELDALGNDFVITCTPTAQDFSGTCDKTVYEVYEAYMAGKNIIVKTTQDNVQSMTRPLLVNVITYGSAVFATLLWLITYTTNGADYLIKAYTNAVGGGYSTEIYDITELKLAPQST